MSRPVARALATLLLAAAGGGAAAADPPLREVRAPYYGDTLFHFFQDKQFSAITGLMVSQHFDRVREHADEAEVLRGGMLLSYGLHQEAGRIFAALIERGAPPSVRDRAWYFLAKIRYQRGLDDEALAALARIEGRLAGTLEEDRQLLHANVLLSAGRYAEVVARLDTTAAGRATASPYLRYNLGVALVRSGEVQRGSSLLDTLGRAPAADEEARSLRDRANVALGFSALQEQRHEDARKALERVRLNGLHSNKALLGFGWAAASLKQPARALVPWTELVGREGNDAAVLEARIAVPYAQAELGAPGLALAGYQDAIAAFEREHKQLDESIAAVRAGKLLGGLVDDNPGDEMGWFRAVDRLPAMPHRTHLVPVLAQHPFQEAFKNWRDLRFLEKNLADWSERLGVFDDMLANRRAGYAQRLPQVLARARDTALAPLVQQRERQATELQLAQDAADGRAFADARQRALLDRIAAVRETLQRLGPGDETAGARERLRATEGALNWELAQAHPVRLWEARKALRSVDAGLAEAKQRGQALADAQRDEPARQAQLAQRIAALRQQVTAAMPAVATLAREQQGALQEIAVAELQRQQERLASYATQARFAVAQLYDRAAVGSTAEVGDATRR